MSLKAFLTRELTLYSRISSVLTQRSYATASDTAKVEPVDITSVESDPKYDGDSLADREIIKALRNKSKLTTAHHNILNNRRPYEKPGIANHHSTIEYKRKMLGRYGIEGSGVPPGVAWPTKEDIAELKEYERVAYPQTIHEAWATIAAKKKAEEEKIQARENEIAANMAKTEQWERELNAKIAKREAEVIAVKERKERLVEEVRRHFGFKVDPRDEKFKEMLELKEKEDRKRRKEARKKERADKLMAHLLGSKVDAGKTPRAIENNEEKTKPPAEIS